MSRDSSLRRTTARKARLASLPFSTMYLRPATPHDFSATASLTVSCFWDDELFVYTNPKREQYPEPFRDAFLRRHRLRYWSPGFVFWVAVTEPGDAGHEAGGRVVGYAIWERRGTSDTAKRWRKQSWRSSRQIAQQLQGLRLRRRLDST